MDKSLIKKPVVNLIAGLVLGVGGTLGVQSMGGESSSSDPSSGHIQQFQQTVQPPKKLTNYDLIPYDEYGDAYITPSGKKYHHNYYCPSLSKSRDIRQVNSSDADKAGLTACSKCF